MEDNNEKNIQRPPPPSSRIHRHSIWTLLCALVAAILTASACASSTPDESGDKRSASAGTNSEEVSEEADEEASTESIGNWVLGGDGMEVANWMVQVSGAAFDLADPSVGPGEMMTQCGDAYSLYFEDSKFLDWADSAPEPLQSELETIFNEYEQAFDFCSIGDFVNAIPHVDEGNQAVNRATAILDQYAP